MTNKETIHAFIVRRFVRRYKLPEITTGKMWRPQYLTYMIREGDTRIALFERLSNNNTETNFLGFVAEVRLRRRNYDRKRELEEAI